MYHQLTGQELPESAKTDRDVMGALKDAATSTNVLLVLDDVWDPNHEKALNFIDPTNDSKLLVTTRIRGLMKNSTEVEMGVLPQDDALKLLLTSAEMEEGELDTESDDHRIALEIVELCGRLPLTLAIAGGMIADNGQALTEDIVDVMKESHELEDAEGHTLEERIISSSVKMMINGAGKHKELVEKAFKFFAVFPEDVPIPAAVFNKMAPLLSNEKNEKKARLAVGSSLSTLLKYNLVKGSLVAGHGVFMHDVVRDFVINQHSPDELRELQAKVVVVLLAARPEPDGFPNSGFLASSTFEGYVVRNLSHHFRGAMAEGAEPPDEWLSHPDQAILVNTAMAFGVDFLTNLSEAWESAGQLVRAAHAIWTASVHKAAVPKSPVHTDMVYRAADLLERADSKEDMVFEAKVVMAAMMSDMGSERHTKACRRQIALGAGAEVSFETRIGEAQAFWMELVMKVMGGGVEDAKGNLQVSNSFNFQSNTHSSALCCSHRR